MQFAPEILRLGISEESDSEIDVGDNSPSLSSTANSPFNIGDRKWVECWQTLNFVYSMVYFVAFCTRIQHFFVLFIRGHVESERVRRKCHRQLVHNLAKVALDKYDFKGSGRLSTQMILDMVC